MRTFNLVGTSLDTNPAPVYRSLRASEPVTPPIQDDAAWDAYFESTANQNDWRDAF